MKRTLSQLTTAAALSGAIAFIGGSLKLRGSDATPIRPIAIPVGQPARRGKQ